MKVQPRYDPLESSSFFPDNRSARPLVTGVVPREVDPAQEAALSARGPDGNLVEKFPYPITLDVLKRGQELNGVLVPLERRLLKLVED